MTKKMSVNKYSKAIDKIIASKKPIVEQFMDLMGLMDVTFIDTRTVNEKNSIPEYISECCKAPVIAVSGILDTDTFHFECMKCRKACNPIKRPKKQDGSVQDRRTKLTNPDSIQKRISTGIDMSRDGSQTKRKRDATTGSTVKAHLDWRDKYLDKFHTTPHKGIEEFISILLSHQRQQLLEEILEVIKDSPYLYIGRFEEYIKSLKKI